MSEDTISRQAAIDAWKNDFKGYINALDMPKDDYNGIMEYIDEVPPVQPEDCDTCKHGYFGDSHCDNCRVRYPSHYERRTDE